VRFIALDRERNEGMISGTVTDFLDATIPLAVLGANGQPQRIEAVLDTGFSGFLTLPLAIIESLQLPWMYRQRGMLADGQFHPFDVYAATSMLQRFSGTTASEPSRSKQPKLIRSSACPS
jgi:predicted aspartyl protease